MGKDLRGKELGVGIVQRKDGLYMGRFTNRSGKKVQKYFTKLQECRRWLNEAQYLDATSDICATDDITVDVWFNYWLKEIKGNTIRHNTIRNYTERYNANISNVIGKMHLNDVKPLHCQHILNLMKDCYRSSTIYQTRITLYCMFSAAVENEVISKNPVTKSVQYNIGKDSKAPRVLSVSEQQLFLKESLSHSNYNQFAFILQTGLRTGEMIGLQWSDIDFSARCMHISRSAEYRYKVGHWKIGPVKSKAGVRDVPLTDEALQILANQKEKVKRLKIVKPEFKDYIFLCRKGEPTKNSAYDTSLVKICDKLGIQRFSMHTLRHTFATRCIEGGMRPKTLQTILGHSNISITMNLYVHVTEDEKVKELCRIQDTLKVI